MHFTRARLMQQPLYDLRDKLVPPWDAQKEFRQGTLVLVEAVLNVHHYPPHGNAKCGHSVRSRHPNVSLPLC